VPNPQEDPLREIEEIQAELRKSIEHSRDLAERSQELLDKHRLAQPEQAQPEQTQPEQTQPDQAQSEQG
jgi:hypothetical protein